MSSWLDALRLPTRVMGGLFLGSAILLALDENFVNLADLGAFVPTLTVVVLVISGSLFLAGIVALIFEVFFSPRLKASALTSRRAQRAKERSEQRKEAQDAALRRIDHLAPEELRVLADSLRQGSQSFYTYVHTPPVTTLMGKGLVYTPGGNHHRDYYPFTIHDFAWEVLLRRKDELIRLDEENREREERENGRR